jgi:hypothetical protein
MVGGGNPRRQPRIDDRRSYGVKRKPAVWARARGKYASSGATRATAAAVAATGEVEAGIPKRPLEAGIATRAIGTTATTIAALVVVSTTTSTVTTILVAPSATAVAAIIVVSTATAVTAIILAVPTAVVAITVAVTVAVIGREATVERRVARRRVGRGLVAVVVAVAVRRLFVVAARDHRQRRCEHQTQ